MLDASRRQPPRVAIVLGSGLGSLASHFTCEVGVPYGAVPDLEPTTVQGHKGEVQLGTWAGQRVLLFLGRLHYYEGRPWRNIEEQVPMAQALGAEVLLLTNAAGGIRDDLIPGSLLPISDHIEWTRSFAWRHGGPGERPSPYSPRLLAYLGQALEMAGVPRPPGVYAQVTGPCYETPAEIRALQSCGAAVVGMSTCREINRARALGMECAALSCVTNRAAGLSDGPINHEEVIAIGATMRARVAQVLEGFLGLVG